MIVRVIMIVRAIRMEEVRVNDVVRDESFTSLKISRYWADWVTLEQANETVDLSPLVSL